MPNCLSPGAVIQNLKDAGCCDAIISSVLDSLSEGQTQHCMRLLARQREHLLTEIHDAQKRIDCLDYLVYHVKKEILCDKK